jgi:hypothetical protein
MPPRGRSVTSGSAVTTDFSGRSLASCTRVARASCASMRAKCAPMPTRAGAERQVVLAGARLLGLGEHALGAERERSREVVGAAVDALDVDQDDHHLDEACTMVRRYLGVADG